MKLNKKKVAPFLALVFALSVGIGTTYALFTSGDDTDISVTSGKVKVTSTLTNLELYSASTTDTDNTETILTGSHSLGSYSADYYHVKQTNGYFSNGGTGALNSGNLVLTNATPGDMAKATLSITNTSNVDIKYRLVAELTDTDNDSKRFFSSLEFTALNETLTNVRKFSTIWTTVEAGATIADSDVKVYLPLTVSDELQSSSCHIKFSVEAVQENTYTVDDNTKYTINFEDKATSSDGANLEDLEYELEDKVKVSVPLTDNTFKDGDDDVTPADVLTCVITEKQEGETGTITAGSGEIVSNYDVSLYNKEDGTAITSTAKNIEVTIFVGYDLEILNVYHDGNVVPEGYRSDSEYYTYDISTGCITIYTNKFSPFNVKYKGAFESGSGTEADPYCIANGQQWYNLIKLYQGYYMGGSTEGLYVKLTGDIDMSEFDMSSFDAYPRNFHLDGNNKTFSNLSTTIWGGYGGTMYLTCEFKNFTIKDSDSGSNSLFDGTQNSSTASVSFVNVDLDNCYAGGGAYLYYCGSGTASFKDCDATNTHVTGGYMASAGFVGNIGNGNLTIDTCTFGGSVVSTQSVCAAFAGQPQWGSEHITITNSSVLSGTIIRNISGGPVAAFEGMNSSVDYSAEALGNSFNGVLETTGTVSNNGFKDAVSQTYATSFTTDMFTFDKTTGKITYSGTETIGRASVRSFVMEDYIYYGSYYGGYNWYICDSIVATNLTTNGTIDNIPVLTGLYNVVSSDETPVGLKTTDTTHVGEIYEGVFYFDAQTYSWGYYMLNGTYDSSSKTAIEPSSLNVYINVSVCDSNNALSFACNLSYTVTL